MAGTLVRRGYRTAESARAFLDPLQSPPTPASALPGMDAALERIASAVRAHEPICVWGDFDVDGQTATTILVQTLRALDADVTYHIPIRARESHGVNIENLRPIIENGAKLILTCDTGITANEAVDYARARGVDFVVTDHHDLDETLPNAVAVTNPKLLPENHPLANLAGAGVAYKLAEALLDTWRIKPDTWNLAPDTLLDLAAMGLVADLALLKGETRAIVQRGLAALRETERLGLQVIAELANLDLSQATEESIGFTLGPRLNALGRLSDANPAVELLTTKDPARARLLATQIEGLNTQRRLLTEQVYRAAEAQLRDDPSLLAQPVILLNHPSWPGGVVGIVANRLVDRYHKPAILLTGSDDDILRGSARSIEGLHITEAIANCKEYLLGFGGHPMAAGLSLEAEKLPDIRRALNKTVEKKLGDVILEEPSLQIDAWLDIPSISLDLAKSLEGLAPFGAGNPSLIFATRNLSLSSSRQLGKNSEHLKLQVTDENGNHQDVLWWNGAGEETAQTLNEDGLNFDLAYSLRADTFRGERRLTLEFQDLRIKEREHIEVRKTKHKIVDCRGDPKAFGTLGANVLVWAEGTDKVKGRDRSHLEPARELAVYTSPPSPAELRTALEFVKPDKIYLFAVTPPTEQTDDFLARLAGMAKFVINQRQGMTTLAELAASTAQREATIRLGLEWLAAGGHLTIHDENGKLHLTPGDGIPNQYSQRELYIGVKGLLEETHAYRMHFARADADTLLK